MATRSGDRFEQRAIDDAVNGSVATLQGIMQHIGLQSVRAGCNAQRLLLVEDGNDQ